MSANRLIALLLPALAVLLGSCSWMEINKPLFSDPGPDTPLLYHNENREKPILPTDKVKTEAEAINLAMHNCGSEPNDPGHWHASRNGDIWTVIWASGLNTITAAVRKNDGSFEDCDVNDRPLWQ
jgi:hypothetical protein